MENFKQPYLRTKREYFLNGIKPITVDDFNKLQTGYKFILKLIWIREKLNIVLENYYDFQLEVLNAEKELLEEENTQEAIKIGQKYIVNFNRKIANILSSVRMYIDQTKHDLSSLNLSSVTYKDFQNYTAKEYDRSIGYQVMEFLRNYMQHEGLLIDGLTVIKEMFKTNKFINIIVEIDYKRLKSISKYKQKIKFNNILENMNSKKINIMWFVEEYINEIINIHQNLTNALEEYIEIAITEIESIIKSKYEPIENEIGVFSEENKFLLQYYYVLTIKNKPRIVKQNYYNERKIFKATDNIKGNFSKINIKYNIM